MVKDWDKGCALADHIAPEERRAMALLASITDERRFSLYCMTGHMPAMGNVTKAEAAPARTAATPCSMA